MLRLSVVLCCAFVLLSQPAQAQTQSATHQHAVATIKTIDGALHPELIPDATAYRLYLFAVSTSANPTEAERKHQHAHLRKTGIDENDRQVLIGILSDFRMRYDGLVAQYNASAAAALARNETTDVRPLLKAFDDLVQSTRDVISTRLTPKGAAQLHSFVISEKKNMKVQPED